MPHCFPALAAARARASSLAPSHGLLHSCSQHLSSAIAATNSISPTSPPSSSRRLHTCFSSLLLLVLSLVLLCALSLPVPSHAMDDDAAAAAAAAEFPISPEFLSRQTPYPDHLENVRTFNSWGGGVIVLHTKSYACEDLSNYTHLHLVVNFQALSPPLHAPNHFSIVMYQGSPVAKCLSRRFQLGTYLYSAHYGFDPTINVTQELMIPLADFGLDLSIVSSIHLNGFVHAPITAKILCASFLTAKEPETTPAGFVMQPSTILHTLERQARGVDTAHHSHEQQVDPADPDGASAAEGGSHVATPVLAQPFSEDQQAALRHAADTLSAVKAPFASPAVSSSSSSSSSSSPSHDQSKPRVRPEISDEEAQSVVRKGAAALVSDMRPHYLRESASGKAFFACAQPGMMTLAFDDGQLKLGRMLLPILQEKGIKSTWFMVGSSLAHPARLRMVRMALDDGHEMALHTWSHQNLGKISDQDIVSEIEQNIAEMARLELPPPRYFRPPQGAFDGRVQEVLFRNNISNVLWSFSLKDYASPDEPVVSKDKILGRFHRILASADPRVDSLIGVQHFTQESSVQSVLDMADIARARGWRIVSLDECLHGFQKPAVDADGNIIVPPPTTTRKPARKGRKKKSAPIDLADASPTYSPSYPSEEVAALSKHHHDLHLSMELPIDERDASMTRPQLPFFSVRGIGDCRDWPERPLESPVV